jgi:excisionase family DNA binding protein
MDDRWMTVKDVAEYLQLSTDQIYRLAQQGKIPASKVGARWRFKRGKIDEWVENQSVAHKTQLSVGEGG